MTAIDRADRSIVGESAAGGFAGAVVVAVAAAWWAPLTVLLLAPLVLGLLHVLGDVRVLVVQRPGGLCGRAVGAILVPLAVLTLLRVASMATASAQPRLELACGFAAVAIAAGLGLARGGDRRRSASWALGLAAIFAMGLGAPHAAQLTLAHAHNLVAFTFWLVWSRARAPRRQVAIYLAGFAAVLVLPPLRSDAAAIGGLSWSAMTAELAPGVEAGVADVIVRSFVYAQLLHYALWVGPLPSAGRRTWRQDLGAIGPGVVAIACVLLPALALFDPAGTRGAYLSLAIGHGWLELAVAAFLLTRMPHRAGR